MRAEAAVDDGLHDPLEIQGRGDLAADGKQGVELFDLFLGLVPAGVPDGADGLAGEILEQLLVFLGELGAAPALVGDDDGALDLVLVD